VVVFVGVTVTVWCGVDRPELVPVQDCAAGYVRVSTVVDYCLRCDRVSAWSATSRYCRCSGAPVPLLQSSVHGGRVDLGCRESP